jgi:hypothetical protein
MRSGTRGKECASARAPALVGSCERWMSDVMSKAQKQHRRRTPIRASTVPNTSCKTPDPDLPLPATAGTES